MMRKVSVIIVAGGKGLRMGSEIPKQFLVINNLPILMHTIKAFASVEGVKITVVLPQIHIDYWQKECAKYNFNVVHNIVEGGDTRFQSVRNGLLSLKGFSAQDIVMVHDGVRPLVSDRVIQDSIFALEEGEKGVVPVIPIVSSLREIIGSGCSRSVDRANYVEIQTPQTFIYDTIYKAYNDQSESMLFTDDASVVESHGVGISFVTGDRCNLKITTEIDLELMRILLKINSI